MTLEDAIGLAVFLLLVAAFIYLSVRSATKKRGPAMVYGMLGYVWISGRRNPQNGLGLHQQTAVMMFGWYLLCWTGLLGPIANWAHTAGLVIGIAFGFSRQRN